MTRAFRISVPASSANLGPGFDCLGVSLGLRHRLTVVERPGSGLVLRAMGEGARSVPLDERNTVFRALQGSCRKLGYEPRNLELVSENEIPLACGLGSSAAARVAGVAAGMLLSRGALDSQALVNWGAREEGHPDNVTPCVLGGFTVAVDGGDDVEFVRFEPPPGLTAVLVIPQFRVRTREARRALPERVSWEHAVANVGRAALLTAAMAAGQLEPLRTAMQDQLHQPFRRHLVPGLEEVCAAAREAGALGAVLSGAGPAILALTTETPTAVGRAMRECWANLRVTARYCVLSLDASGIEWSSLNQEP